MENTKETVAEESVNTADETAEKSAEAVSEENTEGLENADRSESAEEKKTFSTETETPVENLKMPTLNIPDSMKNMVPEEIEVPKAPVQNNLFSDEADAAEKMKDEKPAFDFSNFNLEDTILAAASAQFPLPVITGIGHERDDTVLDSVAHTRVKTPTAAAEFLIESMDSAADELEMLASRLHEGVRNLLQQEQRRLSGYKNRIPSAAYHRISDAKMALLTVRKDVVQAVTSSLFRHRHRLELLQQRLADASPEKLLARGYSITLKDGKVVKNADELQENDMITTRLQNGEVVSIVHI